MKVLEEEEKFLVPPNFIFSLNRKCQHVVQIEKVQKDDTRERNLHSTPPHYIPVTSLS